ncbi:hypothetical protein CLOM_g21863 [Closterium sp. NIES-68]|nr:hypothetical protein CLOM_g21863 [Closterium sp. NIES-68]
MAGDEVSSGSSVSIGDPQMRALLEALSRGQLVVKPAIGLSEAQRFNGSSYSTWRLKFSRRAEECEVNSAEKAWACLESMYLRPSNANKSARSRGW